MDETTKHARFRNSEPLVSGTLIPFGNEIQTYQDGKSTWSIKHPGKKGFSTSIAKRKPFTFKIKRKCNLQNKRFKKK